jgi:cyclopropane-fatty-acyl-phospholipid synthase
MSAVEGIEMSSKGEGAGASVGAIQHHYDLSNTFYALWLDASRTYSCAMWEANDSLESAQQRKLDYHIEVSRARDAAKVLDVGCGWGSALVRLVEHAGVGRAVGLTLSEEQAKYIRGRAHPRIDVRVESWAQHTAAESYDAVISIGAFEHFARPGLNEAGRVTAYREFFRRCYGWLRPDGCLSLQTIAYGTASRKDLNAFILEEIFPESDLPVLSEILQACDGLFEIVVVRNDRMDYARTFSEWSKRLAVNRDTALSLIGESKLRAYEKYHGIFQIGFHVGAMNLFRIGLRRLIRTGDGRHR